MNMSPLSVSDLVFVNSVADDIEEKFSDMSGRLVELAPGDFKIACFKESFLLHQKLGCGQYHAFRVIYERILSVPEDTLIEEFKMMFDSFIFGAETLKARMTKNN
jgi:hypothetical protein